MKNFITLCALISFGLIVTTHPSSAATGFTISGTTTSAQTLSGGTGLVTATGSLIVSGSGPAINVTGTSTITNLGYISETGSGRAIRDSTGGLALTVTNGSSTNSSATIKSIGDDAFQLSASAGGPSSVSLDNWGTIMAGDSSVIKDTSHRAINWTAAGANTLTNESTGVLQSTGGDAVRMGANGVLTNTGKIYSYEVTISGTATTGSDGMDGQNNSGISITNGTSGASVANQNLIEGGRHGITGQQLSASGSYTMSITNNANGTIQGDNGSGINIDGFNASETVTVVNAGSIIGNGATLTAGSSSQDGDGVDIDGVVNITNSGTIKSLNALGDTSEGITVGGGTISNSGTIEGSVTSAGISSGSVGRGITLAGLDKDPTTSTAIPIEKIYADTTVTNSGLIKGDTDSGIAILGINTTPTGSYTAQNFSVTITNTLGGVIEGAGAVAVIDGSALANGVGTASANNETVINYGTIHALGSGKAISLGMGNNSVQIVGASAQVIGDMSGGTLTGTNTAALTIDPTAGHSFSYGGVISNFTSVEILSGTVTFTGANTYNGTTTIDAATLNLTGTGSIGTTTVLTINTGGVFDLGGGTVTVGSLNNSGLINNGTVNTTGTGTINGLSGNTAVNKTSAGTTVITGTNTYTGGTTVSNGKLAVNGSITGNVNVHSGAELGGSGTISGTLSGSGTVGPGNSPGILTAGSTDPTGGMSYNFELTQVGTATWSNSSASGNDVLHLTAALPFTAALTSGNSVDLYFSALNLTFEGGFFTDGSTNTLTANLANATFNYFVLDNASGTFIYNGNKYDQVTGTAGVVQVLGANFGTGTVNGWTEQFTAAAVPEPSTYVLLGFGALGLYFMARRNRRA